MEAIWAKISRLLEVARDTDPLQPNTLQRHREALLVAMGFSMANTSFAPMLMESLDNNITILTIHKRKVEDLTALLQTVRRHAVTTRRHGSLSAHLAGLFGDDLFRKLMALYLPADTTPPDIYLEAALAAQRLIMHDYLDKYIHLYEKILIGGNTLAAYENSMRFFRDHVLTLEKFVQEHMELATATVSRPSTGPAK